ncbi:MAG: hypothetical protein KGN36_20225 [Acidobacteriota bacterium]|nr:hypothetical protein [Acidobacteriota bacterium]
MRPAVDPPAPPHRPPKGGPAPKPKPGCNLTHYWEFVTMGLTAAIGNSKGPTRLEMSTPGPIPMAAQAQDSHLLVQECGCAGGVTRTWIPVDALVRYDWQLASGGGGFIPKTGGRPKPADSGQQVIYQPPPIPYIAPDPRSTLHIRVQVRSIHRDDSKPPAHGPCELGLNLTITRTARDKYVYQWGAVTPVAITNPVNLPGSAGGCVNAFVWLQQTPIRGVIKAPRTCAPGDYVRFEAKAKDTDQLLLRCLPRGACKTPAAQPLVMSDTLVYDWTATGGAFVRVPSKNTPQIVWKAPRQEGIHQISLRIADSGKEFVDTGIFTGARIEVTKPRPSPVALLPGKHPKKKKKTTKKKKK